MAPFFMKRAILHKKWPLTGKVFNEKYLALVSHTSIGDDKFTFYENANYNQFSSFIKLMKDELRGFNSTLPENVIEALLLDELLPKKEYTEEIVKDN